MSEQTPDLATTEQITPADFDFDAWLDGGKIAEQSVPIYGKPGLLADIEDLRRKEERLQAIVDADESGAPEAIEDLEEVRAQGDQLREEFLASEVTWYVRALDDDDYKEIAAELKAAGITDPGPAPEAPKAPKAKPQATPNADAAYQAALEQHEAALEQYQEKALKYANARNFRTVAKATTRMRYADGQERTEVTPAQVERLKKTLGSRQILTLMQAIALAQTEEPQIPAPFSHASSPDDQM